MSISRKALAVAIVAVAYLGVAAPVEGASASGWRPCSPERVVLSELRDDGLVVRIHVCDAQKGAEKAMMVRVGLTGFSDKRLVLTRADASELFGDYSPPKKRPWYDPRRWYEELKQQLRRSLRALLARLEAKVRRELDWIVGRLFAQAGMLEEALLSQAVDVFESPGPVVTARAKAVAAAASSSGGGLIDRFSAAADGTLSQLPVKDRALFVRTLHGALLSPQLGAK